METAMQHFYLRRRRAHCECIFVRYRRALFPNIPLSWALRHVRDADVG